MVAIFEMLQQLLLFHIALGDTNKVVKYVDFLQKNTAYWGFKINTSQYATIRSILGVVKYVQQYA